MLTGLVNQTPVFRSARCTASPALAANMLEISDDAWRGGPDNLRASKSVRYNLLGETNSLWHVDTGVLTDDVSQKLRLGGRDPLTKYVQAGVLRYQILSGEHDTAYNGIRLRRISSPTDVGDEAVDWIPLRCQGSAETRC